MKTLKNVLKNKLNYEMKEFSAKNFEYLKLSHI